RQFAGACSTGRSSIARSAASPSPRRERPTDRSAESADSRSRRADACQRYTHVTCRPSGMFLLMSRCRAWMRP
ncbi:hypothetical protein PFISCL1PPCAC_3197, partial [Pristionchus fissidentatus]